MTPGTPALVRLRQEDLELGSQPTQNQVQFRLFVLLGTNFPSRNEGANATSQIAYIFLFRFSFWFLKTGFLCSFQACPGTHRDHLLLPLRVLGLKLRSTTAWLATSFLKHSSSWVWWYTPLILSLGSRDRWLSEFEVSLGT